MLYHHHSQADTSHTLNALPMAGEAGRVSLGFWGAQTTTNWAGAG